MRILTIEEIKSGKKKGDLSLAAEIIGVSQGNASKILVRPLAKRHVKLITALSRVIYLRDVLRKETDTGFLNL